MTQGCVYATSISLAAVSLICYTNLVLRHKQLAKKQKNPQKMGTGSINLNVKDLKNSQSIIIVSKSMLVLTIIKIHTFRFPVQIFDTDNTLGWCPNGSATMIYLFH